MVNTGWLIGETEVISLGTGYCRRLRKGTDGCERIDYAVDSDRNKQ